MQRTVTICGALSSLVTVIRLLANHERVPQKGVSFMVFLMQQGLIRKGEQNDDTKKKKNDDGPCHICSLAAFDEYDRVCKSEAKRS